MNLLDDPPSAIVARRSARPPLYRADLEVAREHERLGNYDAASANALLALVQYHDDERRSAAEAARYRGPG